MAAGDASISRREVLTGTTAVLGGIAGCTTTLGTRGSTPVSMLAAGSLNNALENGLKPRVDATLQVEAHGSAEVARLVAAGQKDPDVVSVSDLALFASPLQPPWFAEFATNAIVVAYNADTEGGQRIADAGRDGWYRPLLGGEVALGRTDPDLDPLGYRTLFVLELASRFYDADADLRDAIPRRRQVYPETQLVSQFETGAIDAAITYRNMAVERGYDYVELPAEIDLSDPAYADNYATATYELPSGMVVEGGVVNYASTVRHESPAVFDVFDAHVTGDYLTDFGFTVPDDYPRFTGNVPDRVTN
ncbi:extracellular solute-binding protein [Halobacterium zhouii]|uniref:extracellular solute-binding protein n=1 Tax=Halobacterium zhouii TaxID=2902624 RepID=UPI001E5EEB8E|nr:extracellular solute-binding protein [Halobacterium zhouii]